MGFAPRSPDHRRSRFEFAVFVTWLVVVSVISAAYTVAMIVMAIAS